MPHNGPQLVDLVTDVLADSTPSHRLWLLDTSADVLGRMPSPCGNERCSPDCPRCMRAMALGILWLASAPPGYGVHIPPRPERPAPVERPRPAHEQVAERLRARRLARGEVG